MVPTRFPPILLLPLFAACAPPRQASTPNDESQSYRSALELICTVDARLPPETHDDVIQVSAARWDRIRQEVKHPDAIYFRTILETQPPTDQVSALRSEAQRTGLGACPLADTIAADDSDSSTSPATAPAE